MAGSLRSREEVIGKVNIKEKKVPEERRFYGLEPYSKIDVKNIHD